MNNVLKPYMQPAFLLCAAALAAAAASKETAIKLLGVYLKKEPIPLRTPLDALDASRLAPYRVVREGKVEGDVLEELGTDNYIQWELEDSESDKSSPVRYCSLFITYYDLPDRVPHVPEECITGGAGDTILSSDVERLRVDVGETSIEGLDVNGGIARLPVRDLVFLRNAQTIWESEVKYPVLYFFKVNGGFATGRTGTRRILGENLFGRHSYFSKVEWQFYGLVPGGRVSGSKEEVMAASEKLMTRLLPLLEAEHWPDWKAANRKR